MYDEGFCMLSLTTVFIVYQSLCHPELVEGLIRHHTFKKTAHLKQGGFIMSNT